MIKGQQESLAKLYADALTNIAKDSDLLDETESQCNELLETIFTNHDLVAFFEGPHIVTKDKHDFIDKCFTPFIVKHLSNLLHLLIDRGRSTHIRDVLEEIVYIIEEKKHVKVAEVKSAIPLNDKQKFSLLMALTNKLKNPFYLTFTIDPELIAGIEFSTKDILIDGTIRGHLNRIQNNLEELGV